MSISYVPQNQNIERERERVKRWFLTFSNNPSKSFTLVELLIVIGILAALASAVVVVINPTEMLRQGRDSTRMREIGSIHRALSMFQVDRPTVSIGSPDIVYVSIPSDSPTCVGLGLPALPPGWTYACRPTASHRNIDGTGWIPINFTTMSQGSPLSHLPIDPTNTAGSSNFYVYVTDGRSWVLASLIESERHGSSALRDGGTDFARFEVGNNLSLWTNASGLVGYWSFDEGTGLTANDLSRLGNTGTLINGPTWTTGRVGGALSFDGVNDFVTIRDIDWFDGRRPWTISFWMNSGAFGGSWARIISDESTGFEPLYILRLPSSNIIQLGLNGGGASVTGVDIPFTPNTWHHIAFTYNGTNLIGYRDGVFITERSSTLTPGSSTRNLEFGRTSLGGSHWNGLLDEILIYHRVLSAAEVRANFNATR